VAHRMSPPKKEGRLPRLGEWGWQKGPGKLCSLEEGPAKKGKNTKKIRLRGGPKKGRVQKRGLSKRWKGIWPKMEEVQHRSSARQTVGHSTVDPGKKREEKNGAACGRAKKERLPQNHAEPTANTEECPPVETEGTREPSPGVKKRGVREGDSFTEGERGQHRNRKKTVQGTQGYRKNQPINQSKARVQKKSVGTDPAWVLKDLGEKKKKPTTRARRGTPKRGGVKKRGGKGPNVWVGGKETGGKKKANNARTTQGPETAQGKTDEKMRSKRVARPGWWGPRDPQKNAVGKKKPKKLVNVGPGNGGVRTVKT